jgi:hypothetical protein
MSNIIYDLKIVNEKIRADLKEQFPSLSFSVKKDSRKIYINLVSGNFKPFKAGTIAEETGYDNINSYNIESDPSLTDEAKNVMKMVKEITQKYNYDNSDLQSDYFDVNFYLGLSIGSYGKPYQYKPSSKMPTKSKAPSKKSEASSTGDRLLHEFNGWNMYIRDVKGKEVYVIIKDKSTPSNKESWADIKSEMYLQSGFKWNPSYQCFVKWGKIPDENFNKIINIINDILNKYYSGKKEQPAPTPESTAPEASMPQKEPKEQPKDVRLSEYLKTYKSPSDVNNREERLEILNELETRLDNLFDFFRSDKEGFFKLQNVEGIFLEIKVGDKELNLLDGLKLDFEGEETKRFTLIELLKRIIDIGGIAKGWTDIIFGVEVTVDGEVESESKKSRANERAKEEKRLYHEEDELTGGALGIYAWYSFSRTINAAKNFLNDEFEASFKYAQFTDKLKQENQKEVILDDVDYKGNPIKSEAKLFIKTNEDKFVYLLEQGGYTGLYSNRWEVGYRMMKAMIDKKNKLLSYVKDVDPFGSSKVGAKEFLPQLIAQAPDLFPKSAVETDRGVLQSEIDGLEQFLKDFPDLSDDETKLILSQILDLHNLLNLI